jgi:hypothetical protein
MPPNPPPAPIGGRWTITHRHANKGTFGYRPPENYIDGPECRLVEVVPVPDEAAIERGAKALAATDSDYRYVSAADIRNAVLAVLRAALETTG